MRELNAIGREDNTLLLVSADGEQFTVTIDEALTRTIKEHRVPDQSGEQLTPRQIQDAIRAGESISKISERSGTSLSLVERFAHPVLEELQHMVDLALSVRVELPADRFNEIAKKPFGEVISENLISSGATNIEWSAKRGENSIWELHVSYQLSDSTGSAIWTFDPRRYLLTAETTNAQSLSKPGSTIDSPLRSTPKSATPEHPAKGDALVTADKLEAFRSRRAKAEAIAEPTVQLETVEEVSIIPAVENVLEPESPVLNEVEPESSETTESIEVVSETKPVVESKKSRAPMPSWDQIVRGTQSDDEEAF